MWLGMCGWVSVGGWVGGWVSGCACSLRGDSESQQEDPLIVSADPTAISSRVKSIQILSPSSRPKGIVCVDVGVFHILSRFDPQPLRLAPSLNLTRCVIAPAVGEDRGRRR